MEDSQEIGAGLLERGHQSFCAGDYEKAKDLLAKALTHLRLMPPSTELATCLYWLENSAAMFEERRLDPAPFLESLPLFLEAGLNYMAANCCEVIADSAISNGHLATAGDYLGLAREHYADSDTWVGVSRIIRKFAELALLKGNLDEAIRLYQSAFEEICIQPQGLESVRHERSQIENFGERLPN